MFLGLRTVIYPVADLAAATAWWTEVLGFGPYFDEPFHVGFEVAGYELGLQPGGKPGDAPLTYWGAADGDAVVARLVATGATVVDELTEVGDGIRVGTLQSPDGTRFGVIENPHFQAAARPAEASGPGR